MRKEVLFAIIAGIIGGLFLAFGLWKISSKVSEVVTSPRPTNTDSTSPTPVVSFSVSIISPKNKSVSVDEKLTLQGKTAANSWVVISTVQDDYLTQAEDDGSFSSQISLSAGYNMINITAISASGQQTATTTEVVYSSEFSKYTESAPLNATFYSGGITDINSTAIQIQGDKGGIQQLTLSSDATFNKVKKPQNNTETIKSTDLAIGDYILAMGFTNGTTTVLDTKRVIVGSIEKNQKEAVLGTLTDITKKAITLSKADGTALEITLPKTWDGPDTTNLETEQQIIVIGTSDEDGSFTLYSILELNQ